MTLPISCSRSRHLTYKYKAAAAATKVLTRLNKILMIDSIYLESYFSTLKSMISYPWLQSGISVFLSILASSVFILAAIIHYWLTFLLLKSADDLRATSDCPPIYVRPTNRSF